MLDLVDTARAARWVESLVTSAVQKRLTTPSRLAGALMRRKKIKWRPMVESMLFDVAEGAHSPLELQYLRCVERQHGLPRGHRQRRIAHRRVVWIDVDCEDYDTRAEVDGRLGHEGDGRFRDRRRDNASTVARRWSLRYGHGDLFSSPCDVATEVACVLADRGWDGSPKPCRPGCPTPRAFHDHVHRRLTGGTGGT